MVKAFPQDFDDFAVLFAVLFVNPDMAFGLSCFVVGGQPGANGAEVFSCVLTKKGFNAKQACKNQEVYGHRVF